MPEASSGRRVPPCLLVSPETSLCDQLIVEGLLSLAAEEGASAAPEVYQSKFD